MNSRGVFSRSTSVPPYKGIDTLRKWIKTVADGEYAGVEKTIVDKLVEMNDHVIDLEMAIPAWKQPKVAVRMDLVAIENGKVVFWEAKTVDDSRIRCRTDFEEDKFPHVLKQLSEYRIFLDQDCHREQVGRVYQKTAELLVNLRELADKIGPTLALGDSIKDASKADKLEVERQAALVVVDLPPYNQREDKKGAWASWKASYEGKLLGKIPMLVLRSPGSLVFPGAK